MLRLIPLLLLATTFGHGQLIISGNVRDKLTAESIVFTNIGIERTNIGTLSNEDGSFSIRIPENHRNDTLTFSALGYAIAKRPIKQIESEKVTIELEEQVVRLKEVTASAKRDKNKKFFLGNSHTRGGVLEADTLYSGTTMALLIGSKDSANNEIQFPIYLEKARIKIFRNNLPSFKIRVRIFSVNDSTKKPKEDLFQKSVVLESKIKRGWLTFDFSEYRLIMTEPFFIAFEQIITKSDRALIAASYQRFVEEHPSKLEIDTVFFEGEKTVRKILKAGGIDLPGTFIAIDSREVSSGKFSCYERKNSLGKWEKQRGSISATVTLSNQLSTSRSNK